ncbi:MAG: 8-amino-7-oxononanoate synthase [Desulfobulbus propionicus]|nr:MAG: 8-amino-7-oxononanoate synthase [Desulfobulbus propionicus]
MGQDFTKHLEKRLRAISERGQFRRIQVHRHLVDGCVEIEGKNYLNLAGNDYLGLATNRELHKKFFAGLSSVTMLDSYGMGSTASRLMTGSTEPYARLEKKLCHLYAKEAALVFNSGYHLNIGILPALTEKNDLILADKLCHASMIDGMRLSRCRKIRYPHLDYDAIERILEKERDDYNQVYLCTESIFSMDGDEADLKKLVTIKNKWNAVLYVDDAHGVAIRGKTGCGLAEEYGVIDEVELLTGTFGKAFGAQGAFVVCTRQLADYLTNTARSQIFSTGMPPVVVHWINFVLDRIPSMTQEREKAAFLAQRLREELKQNGLSTCGSSNIVPVMIGDAARAVHVAREVCKHGFWVKAVRPPTVPQGSSRLRLSLNSAMNWQQLKPLAKVIADAVTDLG